MREDLVRGAGLHIRRGRAGGPGNYPLFLNHSSSIERENFPLLANQNNAQGGGWPRRKDGRMNLGAPSSVFEGGLFGVFLHWVFWEPPGAAGSPFGTWVSSLNFLFTPHIDPHHPVFANFFACDK